MDDKEKEIQKALGLERGHIVKLGIDIIVSIEVPVVVTGVNKEDVKRKIYSLSLDEKRRIIKGGCAFAIEYGNLRAEYGEIGIEAIEATSTCAIKYIDPKRLNTDYVEIARTSTGSADEMIEDMGDDGAIIID